MINKLQILAIKMQENNYSKEELYKKYDINSRKELTEEQIDFELYLMDNNTKWIIPFNFLKNVI